MVRALAILLLLVGPAGAGEPDARLERAKSFSAWARARYRSQNLQPRWLAGDKGLWFRERLDGATRYMLLDLRTRQSSPLFSHEKLAAALRQRGRAATHQRLPIRRLDLDGSDVYLWIDAPFELLRWSNKTEQLAAWPLEKADRFVLAPAAAGLRSHAGRGASAICFVNTTDKPVSLHWIRASGGEAAYGTLAPGAHRVQHSYAGHAWVARDSAGPIAYYRAAKEPAIARIAHVPPKMKEPRSHPGVSPDGQYEVLIHSDNVILEQKSGRADRLTRAGFPGNPFEYVMWSPNSRHFIAVQTERVKTRTIQLTEPAPNGKGAPKIHNIPYRKPGDTVPQVTLWLIDAKSRSARPVAERLCANAWNLSRYAWTKDGREFTVLYNARGHQQLTWIAIRATTGKARIVINETSKTFLDYAGKLFLHHDQAQNEALWMSERDGFNHLYVFDFKTGKVIRQLTKGPWAVRRVERVGRKHVWFWAGGIVPHQDPYYLHYCRVDRDGSNLKVLTEGDGTHRVSRSPTGRYLIDTWSRVNLPPRRVVRDANTGATVAKLPWDGALDLAIGGWQAPERFVAKGRDGKTDIYGVIYRPNGLNPNKKYPVVEAIYAGPHGAHVPKSFAPGRSAHAVAQLGFIVVQIDGMGTSHRSKAFHDVCWKNLGDSGFPDRIAWIRAAAARYPHMDLTRVGIYGGSAGGQSAMRALIAHPDFYKVASADCGCHDNRMDKIWWNELWMGWPIGPHYAAQSNVVQAHRVKGKLQLILGGMDRNVDPASTFQVVDALVRAMIPHEFVFLPSAGHGAGGTPYGTKRLHAFLVRHLLDER